MWEALKICAPITLMTFAIFTRYHMVVSPGWLMVADTLLVLVSTLSVTFALFGRCHENAFADILLRCLIAAVGFVAMFHPDMRMSAAVAAVLVVALAAGIWRHRQIAPPKTAADAPSPVATGPSGDLAALVAEAKREL
jgi:hypothetical protein